RPSLARIVDAHASAAAAAVHQPTQQRTAVAGRAAAQVWAVVPQLAQVGLVLLPGDVCGQLIAYQDLPLVGALPEPTRTLWARDPLAGIGAAPPPAVGAGVDRVTHYPEQGRDVGPAPHKPARVRPAVVAPPDQNLMPVEIAQHRRCRTERGELGQDQRDDRAGLRIGIED